MDISWHYDFLAFWYRQLHKYKNYFIQNQNKNKINKTNFHGKAKNPRIFRMFHRKIKNNHHILFCDDKFNKMQMIIG